MNDPIKHEADDLAADLLQILDKHGVAQALPQKQLQGLLVDLSIYLVNRDYKILDHGRSQSNV